MNFHLIIDTRQEADKWIDENGHRAQDTKTESSYKDLPPRRLKKNLKIFKIPSEC